MGVLGAVEILCDKAEIVDAGAQLAAVAAPDVAEALFISSEKSDTVAFLNGIPPAEPSWRHSSIASRMAFLTAQSGDPIMAKRFAGKIRAIKRTLLVCCAIGLVIAAVYIWNQPGYRQDIIRSVFKPIGRLFGQ